MAEKTHSAKVLIILDTNKRTIEEEMTLDQFGDGETMEEFVDRVKQELEEVFN